MPRKIRQLIADLEKHGFVEREGKDRIVIFASEGSESYALRPSGRRCQTLSRARVEKSYRENKAMKKSSDRYLKLVAWSEEDQCYIGRCPDLMLGGVHGSEETVVYAELCQAVDEWIRLHEADGRPLPESTALRAMELIA
jgi:hypothetical protein